MDRLKNNVLRLTSHGERQVGSEGHRAAREYLIDRMTELDMSPYRDDSYELPYGGSGTEFVNLIGRIQGNTKDRDPILLGAHYDTCGPIPGADDNASAMAIVLAVVEKLRSVSLDRNLIIAFFDAEEPPYFMTDAMGSIYFFSKQRTEEFGCALILDLVGHDVPIAGFEDLLFITGMESHSALERDQINGREQQSQNRSRPEFICWRHERPSHIQSKRCSLSFSFLRQVGALPHAHGHPGKIELRKDGGHR